MSKQAALSRSEFVAVAATVNPVVYVVETKLWCPIPGVACYSAEHVFDLTEAFNAAGHMHTPAGWSRPVANIFPPTDWCASNLDHMIRYVADVKPDVSLHTFDAEEEAQHYADAYFHFHSNFGNVGIIVEEYVHHSWDDYEGVERGGYNRSKKYRANDIWTILIDGSNCFRDYEYTRFEDRDSLIAWLDNDLNESAGGEASYKVWKSQKAYKAAKAEEQRKRLEGVAANLCRTLNVKDGPASIQFIHAAKAFLRHGTQREQSYREGLREDGLCATSNPFSSAGVEEWFDMSNGSRSRENEMHVLVAEALEWVRTECPLLWASYREWKLRRRQSRKSS